MPPPPSSPRTHAHTFGQEQPRAGERRTWMVLALTGVMMVVEILAGLAYGSMALLADGLHMASHAAAIGITAFAYVYARRRARDRRFSFGTGKVNALAGFTGAILLAGFALLMAWESVDRLLHPVPIEYFHAILVAVLGLVVNGASVLLLDLGHDHHDHNLKSAYLHVMADALTSLLAIAALLTGRYLGAAWMDPAIGIFGALLVSRWSVGLVRQTSRVLLDRQSDAHVAQIRARLEEQGGAVVEDLHVWSVGPGVFAVEACLAAARPRSPDGYRALLRDLPDLVHVTVEVRTMAREEGAPEEGAPPEARPQRSEDP